MNNPYVITIHCDGTMEYNSKQVGGNGFIIEFPDSFNLDPITRYLRNDRQGINRLEMISILEAIEELLSFDKKNPGVIRNASGVTIYTDRFNATDDKALNPYRIQGYRKNHWKTFEGKPVKDKDLLDRIDKTRKKLAQAVDGRVDISYKREKQNKAADKLSKLGKRSVIHSKRIIQKKNRNIAPRKFDGSEIDYSSIHSGDSFVVHVYAWESVQNEIEIIVEIMEGLYISRTIKLYVDPATKRDIHRQHIYEIEISEVYAHHVRVNSYKEVKS